MPRVGKAGLKLPFGREGATSKLQLAADHTTYQEQTSFQVALEAFVGQGGHPPLYLKGNKSPRDPK